MQIEFKTIIKVSEQNKGLLNIFVKALSCDSYECTERKMAIREKEDKKSFISNCLYNHFGNAQADVAHGAVGLLDDAITSIVTITDENTGN